MSSRSGFRNWSQSTADGNGKWWWHFAWWRHRMETFSALLAICAGNSPVTCEFPIQRPVTRSFDVFFDLRLNKRLSKQSWGRWSETPCRAHYDVTVMESQSGVTGLQRQILFHWKPPRRSHFQPLMLFFNSEYHHMLESRTQGPPLLTLKAF